MKKKLLFVAAIVAASTTFAQDGLTSKKGEAYLPEAGDWSIGIDANPLMNYVGNLANAGNNTGVLKASWLADNNAIYFKMFKDENTAYRAQLRLGFGSETLKNSFDTSGTTNQAFITDEMKTSERNVVLGFGIEKRRGNTRIQGVYGAQLMIGLSGKKDTYTYADNFDDNHTAWSTDFFDDVNTTVDEASESASNGNRMTEKTYGSTFMFGLQGFIGVEWFFAPKVSLGAEYTWGISYASTGEGEEVNERWGTTTGATANSVIISTDSTPGGKSEFGIDTGLSGANISLNFHF